MTLKLGRLLLVSTATAAIGVAAYSIYKAGGVKPAINKTIKGTIKAGDWATQKYTAAKDEVSRLVDEAKSDIANGANS